MATAALVIWPFIAMALFLALGPARGLIWACGIGFLFLPEYKAFDLPGLPAYSKLTVVSLALAMGSLVVFGKGPPKPETTDKTMRFVMIALLSGVFLGLLGTILSNTEPLVRAGRFQQGHSIRDLISLGAQTLIVIVPFLLARRFLTEPKYHAYMLFAFVVLGVIYSLLALFEVRMSPQLNRWIYDFFPHSWRQHIRGGGFRPIVFLAHGLSVGFFLFVATVSAFAMVRHTTGESRILYALSGCWILLVLLVSSNMGATILALLFVPLILMLGRRSLMWVATAAALLFMAYPVARTSLPTEQFVAVIEKISPARAQSLAFRLEHEGSLVDRAMERPVFGWGGWGRSRVVDSKGRDSTVIDGAWIFWLGTYGWVGYIAFFGLIAGPVYFLKRRRSVSYASIGLAIILAAALLYSIPNAEVNAYVWLTAGALAGYLQFGARDAQATAETSEPDALEPRQVAYTRFASKTRSTATRRYSRNL